MLFWKLWNLMCLKRNTLLLVYHPADAHAELTGTKMQPQVYPFTEEKKNKLVKNRVGKWDRCIDLLWEFRARKVLFMNLIHHRHKSSSCVRWMHACNRMPAGIQSHCFGKCSGLEPWCFKRVNLQLICIVQSILQLFWLTTCWILHKERIVGNRVQRCGSCICHQVWLMRQILRAREHGNEASRFTY